MEDFQHLRGTTLVVLTSFDRAANRAVHRPLRMAFDTVGEASFIVLAGGPLARRLDACPDVRVARSDLRGRPGGSDQPGRVARDGEPAAGSLATLGKVLGAKFVRYRITPAPEPTPWSATAG